MRKKILITGGLGFLGSHLVNLLREDCEIVVLDKLSRFGDEPEDVFYAQGNILSTQEVRDVFKKYGPFETVYHLAAEMPDKSASDMLLWETNVRGTINVVKEAVKNKTESFIFTSSNVAYGIPKKLPVREEDPLNSLEIYGKSKAKAEKELEGFRGKINTQIIRCPVISGVGRLGLQSILFEFISENKNVYVLGDGSNKYQFVDADDACDALKLASTKKGFDVYNIGADEILSLRQIYQKIIEYAGSNSKIISLPNKPALITLAILEKLNISPLGVYQYSMIGRSLYMDTAKIKTKLHWKPRKTNLDTFIDNYKWYIENKNSFKTLGSENVSSNRSLPKMGVFKLLKMIS